MRQILLIVLPIICAVRTLAFSGGISGYVYEGTTRQPLPGASIRIGGTSVAAITNEAGHFDFNGLAEGTYTIEVSFIAFKTQRLKVEISPRPTVLDFYLEAAEIQLKEVSVSSRNAHDQNIVGKLDINLRPINNSQEILRMIPGLFIAQHAGGGKAEQIFLRGMDLDHGTDIAITVDGMPVNMVSHAHGQGYADLHFVIPELVQNVDFNKGPYRAEKGNLATAGSVDFNTRNALDKSFIKTEVGQFQSYRTVAGIDLLGSRGRTKHQSAYIASEYSYSRSFFENSQHFKRLNVLGKYNGRISEKSTLSVMGSTLWSGWDFSGEIPDRAVDTGLIGFYGALDPTQNGKTSRTNANIELVTFPNSNDVIKNQVYYSYNKFELYSNFTYFLNDSVHGDQIRQREARSLFGYNGSYSHIGNAGNTQVTSTVGINYRHDITGHTELAHTLNGKTALEQLQFGDVNEQNLGIYWDELVRFSDKITMNAGMRVDFFRNQYRDLLLTPALTSGVNSSIVSPKLNFYYTLNQKIQLFLNTGKGFHSNDTRAVVARNGIKTLPAAFGSDLGVILKPVPKLFVTLAGWYLWLDQEFVYSGDEGVVEPTGKTRRYGLDMTLRYQIASNLYFDADVNTAKPRYVSLTEGQNFVPLGPLVTMTGGLTYRRQKGFGGSLRYRYMGDRPANENYSLIAKGYLITDVQVNYTNKKYALGLSIQNLLDRRWKEAQFETTTRLKGETQPVTEICYTPGTPLFAKISITAFF